MKEVEFLGNTQYVIAGWDAEVKHEAGYQLYRVQDGLDPIDYKPMPDIGPGVREIRIHSGGEWRVIYTAKLKGVVYVLEAFKKTTTRTPQQKIKNAKARLNEVLRATAV